MPPEQLLHGTLLPTSGVAAGKGPCDSGEWSGKNSAEAACEQSPEARAGATRPYGGDWSTEEPSDTANTVEKETCKARVVQGE